MTAIRSTWTSWRGRVTEPVIRSASERTALHQLRTSLGVPRGVGGHWTRSSDGEIDLVVGDKAKGASEIVAVGSIEWLEHAPFSASDIARLQRRRLQLPGADMATKLLAGLPFGL